MPTKNILIVGAGITGITLAERCAQAGHQVTVIEKRKEIGGNCYDYQDKNRITIHKYGPHIFHTDNQEVWDYLSGFTDWHHYEHQVLGSIDGQLIPIPFNLNTLHQVFPTEQAERLEKKLLAEFSPGEKVPILQLRQTKDKDLKLIADFVYEKIFLNYTKKQWGLEPEEIDPEVTGRVPILISRDNRYFQDKYQGIPSAGYTKMLAKMLEQQNITVRLNTDYQQLADRQTFDQTFYTGPVDEYYKYKLGRLKYRCFKFELKAIAQDSHQPTATVNYPNDHDYTRITEFKKFLPSTNKKSTVIGLEYPGEEGITGWPILNDDNDKILRKYQAEAKKLSDIHFVGRLGEFKYYDMDDAVANALAIFNKLGK
ncbi:MAG: UDP-galactopyranose mutase [Parcubacteria group bacterium]|nr:UDP-galactopyranose mutase [Parcubacteria group bacterium]